MSKSQQNNKCNIKLQRTIGGGWKPTAHGEWLDTHNRMGNKSIAGTIHCGISFRNENYVVVKYERELQDNQLEQG